MSTLKEVLMMRDNLTADEAMEQIQGAVDRVNEGDDPEDVLYEEFGLEPDYVFDLIELM